MSLGVVLLIIGEGQPEVYKSFYEVFEVLFPFVSGFFFVPLILTEQHKRTLPLVGVTQCSLPLLYTLRFLLTISFQIALIVMLSLLLKLSPIQSEPLPVEIVRNSWVLVDQSSWPSDFLGGPNGIPAILLTLMAPTLLLAGVGTSLAHWIADARVGNLVIFALWMFNRAASITLAKHPLLRYILLLYPLYRNRRSIDALWRKPGLDHTQVGPTGPWGWASCSKYPFTP